MKLTDEQIRMLAQAERMMDSGAQPYVVWRGQRVGMTKEVMTHFGLAQGQTINDAIFGACLKFKVAALQEQSSDG